MCFKLNIDGEELEVSMREELIRQKSYVDNEISKLKTSLENVN
jgi:hypothetical protein